MFYTSQDVLIGEELCINYVDITDAALVQDRMAELQKEWYFECACSRCKRETGQDKAQVAHI